MLIFDWQGREVYHRQFEPRQTQLAVEAGLAGGMYLVQVQQGAKRLVQKLTVR